MAKKSLTVVLVLAFVLTLCGSAYSVVGPEPSSLDPVIRPAHRNPNLSPPIDEEEEEHPWDWAPPNHGDVSWDLKTRMVHNGVIGFPLAGEIVLQLCSKKLIQCKRLVQAK